jgi:hypothetical protein
MEYQGIDAFGVDIRSRYSNKSTVNTLVEHDYTLLFHLSRSAGSAKETNDG